MFPGPYSPMLHWEHKPSIRPATVTWKKAQVLRREAKSLATGLQLSFGIFEPSSLPLPRSPDTEHCLHWDLAVSRITKATTVIEVWRETIRKHPDKRVSGGPES